MADTDTSTTGSTGITLPADLVLTPLHNGGLGTARPVMEWLTTFHLASVVLDPYTNESSWILRTATRILTEFRDCDVRINLIVTAGPADATEFLGPLTERFLVFCDPDRQAVKAMQLDGDPRVRPDPRRRRRRIQGGGMGSQGVGIGVRRHRTPHQVDVDRAPRVGRPGAVPRLAGARLIATPGRSS